MRLGGRLAAAIEILEDIEKRYRPVSEALKDWGLSHRFAGSGDRAAIGNIVYDGLRKKRSHEFIMGENSARAVAYSVLLRQWGMTLDELDKLLSGDRFAPESLPKEIQSHYLAASLENAEAAVQADVSDWVATALEENFADDWIVEAQALASRPPLDIRVNTLKADQEKVMAALARAHPVPSVIARNGIRFPPVEAAGRHPNVTAEVSFEKGWYEVQDEGSQIIADLVGAVSGEQVLDYCAGGGGKTLALAATMKNGGQIHAYDADRRRLAPIVERLRRAGTRNVQLHEHADSLLPLVETFDRVLVDAPCTGSGTWRRRPDTKWKLTEKSLEQRMREQEEALSEASAFVRPGGYLCYVTCSVFAQENESQVYGFCEDNPQFELVSAAEVWQEMFGFDKPHPWSADMKTVTLTPASTGTDGFFFAVMQRVAHD